MKDKFSVFLITDCLDNGNNKKAIQEADKVLKKQKDLQCAKVTFAYYLFMNICNLFFHCLFLLLFIFLLFLQFFLFDLFVNLAHKTLNIIYQSFFNQDIIL